MTIVPNTKTKQMQMTIVPNTQMSNPAIAFAYDLRADAQASKPNGYPLSPNPAKLSPRLTGRLSRPDRFQRRSALPFSPGNVARSFVSRERWVSPRIPRCRLEFDQHSISFSLTRKVPSGSPKLLPKSGIKLLNSNEKLRSRHFFIAALGARGIAPPSVRTHLINSTG